MDALHVLLEEFNNLPPLEREQKVVEAAMEMAEEAMIVKACEWLETNTLSELCLDLGNVQLVREFIDNFRKAMKGE